MRYCPIARNFYRLRRVLIEELGLPREAIRPSATFAELVPREQRRRIADRLGQTKVGVLPLRFSPAQQMAMSISFGLWLGIAAGLIAWPNAWMVLLLAAVPVILLTCWVRRFKATEIDPGYTLGDVALGMTSTRECREAGYQFTRNEIFCKVRFIFMRWGGVKRSRFTRDKTMDEIFSDY
jgi:hypothetical protein